MPEGVMTASPPPAGGTAEFLDLRFRLANASNVIAEIRGRAPTERFGYVVTPNVDHVVRLQRQRSDLWPAYRNAELTLCDSRILGRLAARAGIGLPIVPGSDLTLSLFRDTIAKDDRIAIVGGRPAAIAALCRAYGLTNVAHYDPPMNFIESPAEVERAAQFLAGANARYSFLAVGSPQQELLAYRVAMRGTAVGMGFCIGASLDFLTGRQRRAPRLLQRMMLEWLFRLACQPLRLWRRYLVDGPAIFGIYRHWKLRF